MIAPDDSHPGCDHSHTAGWSRPFLAGLPDSSEAWDVKVGAMKNDGEKADDQICRSFIAYMLPPAPLSGLI